MNSTLFGAVDPKQDIRKIFVEDKQYIMNRKYGSILNPKGIAPLYDKNSLFEPNKQKDDEVDASIGDLNNSSSANAEASGSTQESLFTSDQKDEEEEEEEQDE